MPKKLHKKLNLRINPTASLYTSTSFVAWLVSSLLGVIDDEATQKIAHLEVTTGSRRSCGTRDDDMIEPHQLSLDELCNKASSSIKYSIGVFLLSLLYIAPANAQEQKVPRFAIIKSNHVNARLGPGTTYPIEWVFVSKAEPIKIIAEFEQWRKVEDVEKQGGWVHSSVLSPKRSVVIMGNNIQRLFARDDMSSRIVAKLEPGIRCMLDKCKNHWCKIKCDGYKGWIEASNIWGILKSEEDGI